MLSTEHNKACVDQYEVTGVLESERVQSVRPVRGSCPKCGGDLFSDCRYVGGRGYIIRWSCNDCPYSKVI